MEEKQFTELAKCCGAIDYYTLSTTFETDEPAGLSFTNKQFKEFCDSLLKINNESKDVK